MMLVGFLLWRGGQLQHCRTLALYQPRDQNNLSVREFKRVVMDVGHVHIDLPKSGYLCVNCFVALPAQEKPKTGLNFNVIFERDLCPWKQAHGHVWFSDCREAPRDAVGKLRCHQLVSDLCRSTGDVVQTVVTHGDDLVFGAPETIQDICALHNLLEHLWPSKAKTSFDTRDL